MCFKSRLKLKADNLKLIYFKKFKFRMNIKYSL